MKQKVVRVRRRPFSAYRKFQNMQKEEQTTGRKFVSVRADGTPYMSEEERRRKEYRESKKKWLGGAFVSAFGKRTAALQQKRPAFLIAQEPYNPAGLHKFRDEHKAKFVGGTRGFITA